jgi:hypothetical protein
MKTLPTTFALILASMTTIAQAQYSPPANGNKYRPTPAIPQTHVYVPVSDSNWHGYHAATAAESWNRGQAALIEAQAQFILMRSQAMVYAAEAEAIRNQTEQKKKDYYLAQQESRKEQERIKREARQNKPAPALATHAPAKNSVESKAKTEKKTTDIRRNGNKTNPSLEG